MISLQFYQILLTGLLPFFSTVVAGAARQDRAPGWLNDFISFVTPLAAGVINAVANGAPANGNGLLFLAISTLVANLSHAPFLYNLQQELQPRLLSLGVKPAQIQQIEGFVEHTLVSHEPQLETLILQLIDEVRGSRVQAVPTVQDGLRAGVASAPFSPLPPITSNATAAPVPQQAFPAQSFDWTGVTQAVKP